MENKITNLKKTTNSLGFKVWEFEYNGIKTLMAEVDWIESRKVFVIDILMSMPEGKYTQRVEASADLLKGYENVALTMAAEKCIKSYENEIKRK